MRPIILILAAAQLAAADAPDWRRPVATYSIVARDSLSGQLGVAVQSHWFSVGPIVPWARPGVGAVATQSLVDPAYGPLGLELMAMGKTAQEGAHLPARRGCRRCGAPSGHGRSPHTGAVKYLVFRILLSAWSFIRHRLTTFNHLILLGLDAL